jgi:hypothetical protein
LAVRKAAEILRFRPGKEELFPGRFFVGLAASLGAGISRELAEALSVSGSENWWLRELKRRLFRRG